jgi:beta-glucosidase
MSLAEEASFVVLRARDGYENMGPGDPSLCLPALTLSDGPNGISYHTRGVTQLPAAIGVAASFDPAVARAVGRVEGAEARTKGIDVVQGPELNLARVPESGRIFEAYGEDPYLTGVMGVADVEGIQSEGVMSDAKHYSMYNQETARVRLDQDVSTRVLRELYDAPFAAVVEQARVASIMCAYGEIDGVNACADRNQYAELRADGFTGFVRSDLSSVTDLAAAFRAGLDLVKPASPAAIERLVTSGRLPRADLDRAVERTLREMFAYGLIGRPRPLRLRARADSRSHAEVALVAAERSAVLLKDVGSVLPLTRADRSVAVIGADAFTDPRSAGFGSAHVHAPFVVTPLASLSRVLGRRVRVSYAPGGPGGLRLEPVPARDVVQGVALPAEGRPDVPPEPGIGDIHVVRAANVTAAVATASAPGHGGGWSSWHAVLRVHASGVYEISLEQDGDTWCYVDGRAVLSMPGLHGRALWATTLPLRAGVDYRLAVRWFAVRGEAIPAMGLRDVSRQIAAAVRTARASRVAVVFASDWTSEGVDRPSLSLPGDANALISAVAAANPRTVVVLNTGGAVLMPWLHQVAGVLEAWYPGEQDGAATAAVLTGAVDPSGRLPLTFPASASQTPVSTPQQFPGVDSVVHYSEGLDIGYRWYEVHGITPLFPFGFGLSYTSFALSGGSLETSGGAVVAQVTVTNTGSVTGTDVVQAYLSYPAAAGEPPLQLRAFQAVDVAPGATRTVALRLDRSAFEAYLGGRFETVPGIYGVEIGQSSADLPISLETTAPGAGAGAAT